MNERIKELMKEANKDVPLGKDFWLGLEQFSEKFAELIVRECVSVAMEQYDDTLPWGGVEDVLKHFGVEK